MDFNAVYVTLLITTPTLNHIGISLLHNQYSNIGDPNLTEPAYNNIGRAATGYSLPSISQAGQAANTYQGATNRYINNAPENRSF